jgi:hypothetical protein
VAVIYDDGSCGLWDFYQRLQVALLELPTDLQGGLVSRLVFQPPPSTVFHTAVNAHRKGYLVRWDQDRVGNVYAEAYQKVHNGNITALAVTRSGKYLGTGTSDGRFILHFQSGISSRMCSSLSVFLRQVALDSVSAPALSEELGAFRETEPCCQDTQTVLPVHLKLVLRAARNCERGATIRDAPSAAGSCHWRCTNKQLF